MRNNISTSIKIGAGLLIIGLTTSVGLAKGTRYLMENLFIDSSDGEVSHVDQSKKTTPSPTQGNVVANLMPELDQAKKK